MKELIFVWRKYFDRLLEISSEISYKTKDLLSYLQQAPELGS